jgi:hypothetical protein
LQEFHNQLTTAYTLITSTAQQQENHDMLQLALPHLLRPKDMLHLSCFMHCWRLVAAVGRLPVRMKGSRQHGVLFGECFWQAHLQSEQTISRIHGGRDWLLRPAQVDRCDKENRGPLGYEL